MQHIVSHGACPRAKRTEAKTDLISMGGALVGDAPWDETSQGFAFRVDMSLEVFAIFGSFAKHETHSFGSLSQIYPRSFSGVTA
eukprot:323404-Amphidinium_carterae.1